MPIQKRVINCQTGTSTLVDMTPDEETAFLASQAALNPVPPISKAQCLLYLLSIGKTEADVNAAIAGISDATQRAVAQIEWNYRQPFHHEHPLFAALAPALGVSDVAAAFRAAALL